MTIAVLGIGWLSKEGYGCAGSGLRYDYEKGKDGYAPVPKRDIFSRPFRNFGRLDTLSKMTAFAVSLALKDAGIECSPTGKQDIGIVGTNTEGSLRSDIEYFRDYLAAGRTLGRGNLFIYTLPSSPLGEAAIHFGLLGPLVYAGRESGELAAVLDLAGEMILAGESPVMLAGRAEIDEALYFVLGQGPDGNRPVLMDISEARLIVEREPDISDLVRVFTAASAGKGHIED